MGSRRHTLLLLLTGAALAASSGCSHLAYQPSHDVYADPKKGGYEYEDLDFKSEDGTKLHAWFFPARMEPGQKKPKGTFVQFHGNAQNLTAHFASLFWVVDAGYNFFTFDYRGYGSSEGSPSQAGVNADALAAIDFIQKKVPKPDGGSDLILYGQSLGGAVLMRAFPELKDRSRVRTVVIEGSFASYKSVGRDVLSRSWITFLFQPLGWLLMSDEYAPAEWIEKISPTPLLVIHGEDDETIPLKFGQRVFELAREPKTFWLIKRGRHCDSMFREKGRYRGQLIDFVSAASPRK